MPDINDLAHRAINNPETLNYKDFIDRLKLFCAKRLVEIGKDKMCLQCPILDFCGSPPSEYHSNLIFQTLLQLQEL